MITYSCGCGLCGLPCSHRSSAPASHRMWKIKTERENIVFDGVIGTCTIADRKGIAERKRIKNCTAAMNLITMHPWFVCKSKNKTRKPLSIRPNPVPPKGSRHLLCLGHASISHNSLGHRLRTIVSLLQLDGHLADAKAAQGGGGGVWVAGGEAPAHSAPIRTTCRARLAGLARESSQAMATTT